MPFIDFFPNHTPGAKRVIIQSKRRLYKGPLPFAPVTAAPPVPIRTFHRVHDNPRDCHASVPKDVVPPPTKRARPSSQDSARKARKTTTRSSPNRAPRKSPKKSPKPEVLSSDSESDGDGDIDLFDPKKIVARPSDHSVDEDRIIESSAAFETGTEELKFVEAISIASVEKPTSYKPAFEGDNVEVTLQYPSVSKKELFALVIPNDKEDFAPIEEVIKVIQTVAQHYLKTSESKELFLDPSNGIVRALRRALSRKSQREFAAGVEKYNKSISDMIADGTIARNLANLHTISLPLTEQILVQTYARTVSLKVDTLKKYENGSDNVYGELLPRFVDQIFKDTGIKSNQIFVDLGSGVGNVVLQAALQVGCESWGCEMMENACELATLQETEFTARCRLWGLQPGEIHLERGDFLENSKIAKILQKADVVLVNNQAFTPELNNKLVNLFLDLKEGCQIVSLKSFVPHDHKINVRNVNSPINLLSVQPKEYFSDSVSWTNAGGSYFVAKKDSSNLKAFSESPTRSLRSRTRRSG
ncbi:MAG: Nucleosomal histone H3-Lys79 methylase [Trizodia sp. TS-e1964]|nr:MAG: Nucleosomal histone H3-Lys79 methylase [Trizodia sp. TS-e1964]